MTAGMGQRTGEVGERQRRRLSPELRRAQILEAAQRTLAGRDPDDVTFEEIAGAAGVSRALVYNYFGDKGGLLAELYLATLADLDMENLRVLHDRRPDQFRLRAVIANYVDHARAHADSWSLVTRAAAASHPAIRAARRDRLASLGEAWSDHTTSTHLTGAVLFTFLEASVHEWGDLTGMSAERAIDAINDLLWNGIGDAGGSLNHHRASGPAA